MKKNKDLMITTIGSIICFTGLVLELVYEYYFIHPLVILLFGTGFIGLSLVIISRDFDQNK